MEEVRQLVQEEGREARNLVAFHVAVDNPARVSRKPPPRVSPALRQLPPRCARAGRLRSASAGRDKRSELRARYWALLFGDLQRSIGEIYNTVEVHENLNECQEVILVLENYTRDFKALGEWFRLKWEYDNTPPPQRPQSLAWEIRKTDFVRPESRKAYSVKSSPSVSGKNSPSLSGHNTPSGKNSPVTGKASPGSGKISPRISSTSPKANIEFFSNKIASKIATKPEPKSAKESSRLSDIKEKDVKDNPEDIGKNELLIKDEGKTDLKQPVVDKSRDFESKAEFKQPIIEMGKAKESPNVCPKPVIVKSLKKHDKSNKIINGELSSQGLGIAATLDAMENEFLTKHLVENRAKNDNLLNQDKDTEKTILQSLDDKIQRNADSVKEKSFEIKDTSSTESPTKSEENFADVSNESSTNLNEKSNKTACFDNPDEKAIKSEAFVADTAKEPDKASELISVKEPDKASDLISAKEPEIVINFQPESVTESVVEDLPENFSVIKADRKKEEIKKSEAKTELKPVDSKTETKVNDAKNDSKPIDSKIDTKPKPAYSQAAAKPKLVSNKPEVKAPVKSTPIVRSKTVVEIPPVTKTRQFSKRNQTNSKCSYPFNLTTGRTSLFDINTAPVKPAPKKPLTKNVQLAFGDAKNLANKTVTNKPLLRPTTLKIVENGNKEKVNPALEKIKDCDEYSSSDTIVTQIDMSRIESSESLRTLVPDELLMVEDIANSIEVLNVDDNKNDNEGWLTVKSRRLSRESKKQCNLHWSNRFNQPSATTSLPTLNMIESPKQEIKSFIKPQKVTKFDRAKSEQPQKVNKSVKPSKPVKVVKVAVKPKSDKAKHVAMIRQKSDVTGLKSRVVRNKATKKEKLKGKELTKNRLHSSLESLTTALARSQESTEEAFDFDKWKAEFKSTFKYLDEEDQIPNHNEILKSADPMEMSEIAEMTSQIEENEKKLSWALDFQSEVDQRKLCEEEDLLNRQIMELQQVSDIDLDTETDDTETDAEILLEDNSVPSCPSPENLGSLAASLEDQYETALAGMSWAERVDTLVVLEALVARDPGRAQQLHAKLSQGIKRRGSLQDALRRLQAKQARAERQRQEYQTKRATKIHQLLARVEEVKVAKNQLIEEKRLRMERRLQKAAENRDQHLKDIVRKAHDEEEKLREIAFIKQLEAENRRHEFLDQCRSHTTRLRQMRREQLGKLEQKAAREAAVGARRQALEAARKLHVESLLEKRKERDARVEELKEQKRQERGDAAREKAEGVKSRLSALAAAAQLGALALRSRIRDKQDASQQRLESHLQAIREKATGPRQATTSESLDPSSKEERELQEETERLDQEKKERDKQKAIKKKARKVKQKLLAGGDTVLIKDNSMSDHITPSTNKLYKVLNQLTNILAPLQCFDNDKRQTNDNNKQNNDNNKQIIENNQQIIENDQHNGAGDVGTNDRNNKNDTTAVDDNKSNDRNGSKNNKSNGIDSEKEKRKSKKAKKADENVSRENSVESNNNTELEATETNVGKKKNKKHKNNNDKPKFSKTESICSSLSDMSKTSCKDSKTKVVIDMSFLERHLNELNRMVEKLDVKSVSSSSVWPRGVVRVLGVILDAAGRDDALSQFTHKSLSTSASLLCRVSCQSGRYLLTDNTCVHLVKLLATLLEKDSKEQRDVELASQLCDCLSIALDAVLCASRLYEKGHKDEIDTLPAVRSRAHTMISYICLSGCVARAEGSEARCNVLTLLTVCANLCQPCDLDVGSDRISAIQSLRCALGTSLCGSRAELCMLFAEEARLPCANFVRAARTAHLLRAIAELDHHILQEAFGEGGWPLEFRAAVARLLSQHAPNDREAPRKSSIRGMERLDQTLTETMVLDLIVIVGFMVVNNPQLLETICDGWSVIRTLCTLPANWLVSAPHCHALLPTLVAVSARATATIASELSMRMLDEYMESPDAQSVKLVQVIKQGRARKTSAKK